jgi:hypothetical protein
MFSAQFRPDSRLPGMGLGFDLGDEAGGRTASKEGVLAGFLSAMTLTPASGTAVVALSNTGRLSGRGAPVPLTIALTRQLLGLPLDAVRSDVAPRPDVWPRLCGWYSPEPGPVTNLFVRTLMGAGAEVVVEGQQLVLKPLTPLPVMRRGMPLHPDAPHDPFAFRVDLSGVGLGTMPVVFARPVGEGRSQRLCFNLMEFDRRPDARNPRRLVNGLAAAGLAGLAVRTARRHTPSRRPR